MSKKVYCDRLSPCANRALTGALILLVILLYGCIPVTIHPTSPFDLPPNFSNQGEVPFQAKWWLDLDDETLSLLINKALGENFSLQIVRERIVEAEASASKTGAGLYPALNGQGTASSTRNHKTDTTVSSLSLGLAASYEFDLWGKLSRQRDAAVFEVTASESDYHTAAISLAAEVATTWYLQVEAGLQLELLTQQKETNSKVLELISSQFRSGKVSIADVLQQRQLIESNISDLARLRSNIRIYELQLAILMGIPPGTTELSKIVASTGPPTLPSLPPIPETGIPLDILSSRPDIASSYQRLIASDYRVAAAIADRLPKLSISANLSTSGERAGDLFNNWLSTLASNLFEPLIDGGQRKAEVERNRSIARQLFFKHGQLLLEAIGEVENSLAREKEQLIVISSLETQLQYATETVDHVGTRYRQGAENYQRVLLALLSQQGLQRSLLTNRRQLINFRIALYRALSGRLPLSAIGAVTENNPDKQQPITNQARGSMQ